jgi:hypothetical protein
LSSAGKFGNTRDLLGDLLGAKNAGVTNKQVSPLLARLDWFFTSTCLTLTYPNTSTTALAMEPSDHAPCVISISTTIPKAKIIRFENYWMEHEHFMDIVSHGW